MKELKQELKELKQQLTALQAEVKDTKELLKELQEKRLIEKESAFIKMLSREIHKKTFSYIRNVLYGTFGKSPIYIRRKPGKKKPNL